jgi:hypothetical protein
MVKHVISFIFLHSFSPQNPSGAVIKKEFKWGSAYFSWRKNVHGHVPVKVF